ncbi:MAG TPA: tyrosine-type recombinase/integrase, partial [Candidatus Dormibacteraeota bacterium]
LREHRARQLDAGLPSIAGGFVFTDEAGAPLLGTNVTRGFQRLLKRSGLPRMRFHDLRHSCVSLLGAQHVPPRVVMEMLGHSTIGVTMNIYAHVVPEAMRDAADAMDRAMTGNR